jgi:YHS domain-containing protein
MSFLLRLLLIIFLLYLFRTVLMAVRRGSPRRQAPTAPHTIQGSMVRDPVCGTYVDQTLALKVRENGGDVYFCSDACRQQYSVTKES